MAEQLSGRVALVTGAASGMGRVMARALAGAGAQVAALDMNREGLDALGSEAVFTGKFLALTGDVSKRADCERVVQETVSRFGGIDILINCAGVNMGPATKPGVGRAKFYEADADGTLKILAINMGGVYLMSRYAAPVMLKKNWGRIVNITTSFDTMLTGGLTAYGTSKAAVEAATAGWAKDLAGTGVTCNILVPGGPTDTAFFAPGSPKPPVLIDPQVMALPIVWLCSPASDGMSGSRFVARDWDKNLPPNEAAEKVRAPAAWPTLAEGAQATRGVKI